jgi:hypothetical protein
MMLYDPKALVRCPGCGVLVSLDHTGRFVTHLPPEHDRPAGSTRRRWCPMSGREPGRIVVESRREGKS